MQNQDIQIIPVQQQDYSQWENIGLLIKIFIRLIYLLTLQK